MTIQKVIIPTAFAALALIAAPAMLQSVKAQPASEPFALDMELGAAVGFEPGFEGGRTYQVAWSPIIQLHFLRLPGVGQIGGGPDQGFSFAPSINVINERKQTDDRRLAGLGNVDAAYEIGGKLAYRWQDIRVFVAARKGFGGHHGWQGTLGADYIAQLGPQWTFEIGPRLNLASRSYMNTYFGVNAAQSLASGYGVYKVRAGIKSAGLESKLKYAINKQWSLIGKIGYARLTGGAARSPIVRAGARDAFYGSIGASYRFNTATP